MTSALDKPGPRVLLCEGSVDVYFFRQLTEVHGIDGYTIDCPKANTSSERLEDCSGKTQFKAAVKGYVDQARLGVKYSGILVARDADDDPVKAANEAKGYFEGEIATPLGDGKIRQCQLVGATAFILLPGDGAGCLETLLLESLRDEFHPIRERARAYCESVSEHTKGWPEGSRHILELTCTHSVIDRKRHLSKLMQGKRHPPPFDFTAPCFDYLVKFLKKFRQGS